ncbi:hypothetical protein FHETE_1943 [Fusarium heterosporum]|uniref:Uncharacterized protein n=1 Tax=Fusarium heterosporum TaxID=42747 RepID=A0A8H5WYN1_FUSHE|nr:hypothetical protein FHETE_1943 [Fusarium heterosporum]
MQNESRLFFPLYYDADIDITVVKFNHKPPPTRQVCCEARHISNKRGRFIFGKTETHDKALWFDFYSDIILGNAEYAISGPTAPDFYDLLKVARNVPRKWTGRDIGEGLLYCILDLYHSCQTLFLVQGFEDEDFDRMAEGDTVLSTRPDGEIVAHMGQKLAWSKVEEEIREAWQDESDMLEEFGAAEAPLPSIVAVDAWPVRINERSRITM